MCNNTLQDVNVKIHVNCCYDDTYNILSFYLWWQQVQVRVLDDDHNNVIIDHHANDNDYDLHVANDKDYDPHVIHDTVRNNNDLVFIDDDDYNDIIGNYRASDSDCDVHINTNTHLKNNNDNVIYDIFTVPVNLSSLETYSSNNRDTCVGCNSHNGDDTDLDLVPNLVSVHLSPIASTHLLLVPSSLEPTSLSSNLFCLPSDCGLVRIGYVTVAIVANLATTSSLSSSMSSSTFIFPPVLDYSFVLHWLSSNAYVLDTIGSSFNPSDVSVLHLILLSESSSFLGCSASSPISLFLLAIKIYCAFNPIPLVLMIILMIMGLCWFLIMAQITSHELGLNPRLNPITSLTIHDILPQIDKLTRCI